MGKNCSSWFRQPPFPWQSTDINKWDIPPDLNAQSVPSTVFNTYGNPYVAVTEFPMMKPLDYSLPQAYYPHQAALGSTLGVRCPVSPQLGPPFNLGAGDLQKNFLVFDHSGNRTSLFLSALSQHVAYDKSVVLPEPLITCDNLNLPEPVKKLSWCELDLADSGVEKSEMHEDTEELNALLYSDDEIEEEEEASTGHSPFPLNGDGVKEVVFDNNEVTTTPTKRKRLNDDYPDASLMDTASSGKPKIELSSHDTDDAESSFVRGNCDDAQKCVSPSSGSAKRAKKEKIKETVGILRNIIPGSKGKDATVVIDEAIRYLKSLKLKAKTLGVDDLV